MRTGSIDGDAEHEADGGVGGAPAALAEDPARAREPDHVPDREEVARVAEPLHEVELLRELPGHVLRRLAAVPPPRPLADQLAQERPCR